jgi:O-antigen ligase
MRKYNSEEWSVCLFRFALVLLFVGAVVGKIAIGVGQALLAAGLVFHAISGGRGFFRLDNLRGSALFLFGFILIAGVSVFANLETIDDPVSNLKRLRYFVIGFLLLVVPAVCNQFKNTEYRNLLVTVVFVSVSISVVFGLLNLWFDLPLSKTKENYPTNRLTGLDGEIIPFAINLQFILIALVVFFRRADIWRELTTLSWRLVPVLIFVAAFGLYFTFSRGAVLGLVAGLLVFGLACSRVVIGLTIVAGILIGAFSYQFGTRYFNFEDELRLSNWKTAAMTAVKYPTFGVGLRNYETRSLELKEEFGTGAFRERPAGKRPKERPAHAHNNYLEAFASTGVFGGLAFLGFCFFWLVEVFRSQRYRVLLLPLVSSFLLTGLFDCTFFDGEIASSVMLLYVLSQLLLDHEESRCG